MEFSPDATRVFGESNTAVAMWEIVSAPELTITRETDDRLVLTWQNPSDTTAYTLQQCPDLASSDWTDITVTTPGRHEITEPNNATFYRLREP